MKQLGIGMVYLIAHVVTFKNHKIVALPLIILLVLITLVLIGSPFILMKMNK